MKYKFLFWNRRVCRVGMNLTPPSKGLLGGFTEIEKNWSEPLYGQPSQVATAAEDLRMELLIADLEGGVAGIRDPL